MNKYDKTERIMNDCRTGLILPFHISHELKQSEYFYNKDYTEFHEHDFYSAVLRVSEEPKAFYLTDLKTEKEVLQRYVNMNAGGTPHSNEEIERVKKMIVELE